MNSAAKRMNIRRADMVHEAENKEAWLVASTESFADGGDYFDLPSDENERNDWCSPDDWTASSLSAVSPYESRCMPQKVPNVCRDLSGDES